MTSITAKDDNAEKKSWKPRADSPRRVPDADAKGKYQVTNNEETTLTRQNQDIKRPPVKAIETDEDSSSKRLRSHERQQFEDDDTKRDSSRRKRESSRDRGRRTSSADAEIRKQDVVVSGSRRSHSVRGERDLQSSSSRTRKTSRNRERESERSHNTYSRRSSGHRSRSSNRTRQQGTRGRSQTRNDEQSENCHRSRSRSLRRWASKSRLFGPSKSERQQSNTEINYNNRSIMFSKPDDFNEVEFAVDDIKVGNCNGKHAVYLRINVGLGSLNPRSATMRFFFRNHNRGGLTSSTSKPQIAQRSPHHLEGFAVKVDHEKSDGWSGGAQIGLNATNFNGQGERATKRNFSDDDRYVLDVTPIHAESCFKAHLKKIGEQCTLPSEIRLQFIVAFDKRAGLEIAGDLDVNEWGGGADGHWKVINMDDWKTSQTGIEMQDFGTWMKEDWQLNGGNVAFQKR